ncbi:hypothetical protein SeLEV6574_g06109 [Synchytrium endobioticum]|uniref:Uncharacterized protein n=1 Tax=Synchytrium endobioticum TaxID=286115 RepID=A0A507CQN7_9FUNG|nr:hypothetical protein SeLEV6574_g06109 [Synchytrium endobioticum]
MSEPGLAGPTTRKSVLSMPLESNHSWLSSKKGINVRLLKSDHNITEVGTTNFVFVKGRSSTAELVIDTTTTTSLAGRSTRVVAFVIDHQWHVKHPSIKHQSITYIVIVEHLKN